MPKQSPEAYKKMGQTQAENKAIEAYLQWITHGVLPAPPGAAGQIETLTARIENETRMVEKVALIARRQALAAPPVDGPALTEGFVKYAGSFSERRSVTYAVWREMGVPAEVLKRAGFKQTKLVAAATEVDENGVAKPKQTRHKMTPEFIAEYVAFYDTHGEEATADRYGYTSKYATSLRQRIERGAVPQKSSARTKAHA